MTRLFNVESYVGCCHHARLFHQPLDKLIPQEGNLPRAYKALLQQYATHSYLPKTLSSSTCPQKLAINPDSLNYLLIGTELHQGEKQRLFIIRDTVDLMTLSTSNFLERRDGYLYSSVYHYWNNYTEISQQNLTKPLVFIDLDSFPISRLIPINFTRVENSRYQVPILNTRESVNIESSYNFTQIYYSICQSLAQRILEEHFPAIAQNSDTVAHLTNYLQKIALFQKLQFYINQDKFDLIIEVLQQNRVFYKQITLLISKIVDIVFCKLNTRYLNQVISTYPQYQFVLISQYNIFSQIKGLFPGFICLNPTFQEFSEIWQKKVKLQFPLFGIYLDTIEFAIKMPDGIKQWIQLSNQEDAISYEGKTTILRGRIPSSNQEFFRISPEKAARLPIRVNSNDYCKNGVPQDYSVKIENPQGTEDVCIRIEFHLQPGAFPELRVTDLEGKHKIATYLIDRKKSSYSYIPIETITSNREQESLNQINRLEIRKESEQFKAYLLQLAEEINKLYNADRKIVKCTNLKKLTNSALQQIHKKNNRFDLLQFIDASSTAPSVSSIRKELQNKNFQKLVDIIYDLLSSNSRTVLSLDNKDLLVDAIIFIGKIYKFSQYLLLDSLFSQAYFNRVNQIKHRNLGNEYLQCFARVAVDEELQKQYFSWFDSYYKSEKTQYLWGYSRVLLWYYNFDSPVKFLNYRIHFTAILENLLSKSPSDFVTQYKQNAFLALLYLLTFRAIDREFCQYSSSEMQMAERVLEHFKNDRIIFNQVSREKSLNHFFQEMIEGTATGDDLESIVRAG